ncbi:glycosyl hydrolase [Tolypothrix sp. FACHB-123]|uniref:glycosyl hydrolase family 8 n=1 Tax=Tolypothrix sp. FACHB-123 TaxID=2692868 RepID=UPI00168968DF|nr:glycosyl hydrolase family 8 [Tolypothrix sp. FACHB-123]MBD2354579.1 glycosyl hydrolase [Tolypothrix sp. FACHB-123]
MRYLSKLAVILCPLGLSACVLVVNPKTPNDLPTPVPNVTPVDGSDQKSVFLAALPESTPNRQLLVESWDSYRRKFIQGDGRVIDYEASDHSTSEGQAYAMLRAVFIDDPETFALTLKWAESNLLRQQNGKPTDNLWAWKWGKKPDNSWGIIDSNFASDGDIDAITALILASRRWQRPEYMELAKTKLRDLWNLSTISGTDGKRYLLPGPTAAFVPNESTLYLNPSYLAPYAFRIFAQIDPGRDWLSLVDSSYQILENSARLSTVGLPSDWVALDLKTNQFQTMPNSSALKSLYSFDAYRVWWRLSLDAVWFNSPQAQQYLQQSTQNLQNLWTQKSYLPARIDLQGNQLVDYDATSQYAMFYAAMRLVKPSIASEVLTKKLLPQYKQGIWGEHSAYYTQNLAWLGLWSPDSLPRELILGK